jgi:hypothetical protein
MALNPVWESVARGKGARAEMEIGKHSPRDPKPDSSKRVEWISPVI